MAFQIFGIPFLREQTIESLTNYTIPYIADTNFFNAILTRGIMNQF